MPSLKPYSQELEYSYAPGLFPSLELMRVQPERALRLLTSEKAHGEGVEKLRAICREHNVREEVADKALRRISGKDNCFAAMVFSKWQAELRPELPHVVRAAMGAVFSLRVKQYDSFEDYRREYPNHALYPFMLDGSMLLEDAVRQRKTPFALIFGNEGSGLPSEFSKLGQAVRIPHSGEIDSLNLSIAVGIGAYAFVHAPEKGE